MADQPIPDAPGTVPDPCLGLTDEEAGHPSYDPPDIDKDLGDAEFDADDDGDDLEEED